MSVFLATLHDDLSYIVYLESCIRDKEHFIPRKRREMRAELKEFRELFNYPKDMFSYEDCKRMLGETE